MVTPARAVLAVVLVVAAFLIFSNLDNRYLWDDEAENALLAQSVLRIGLPIARDAHADVVSTACGAEADRNYLWTLHAWLQFYLTAASFQLLGVSTLAARLPFAILGWLAIPSLYVVGRRLFGDRWLALLACVFMTCSVLFLLHARQSRWYAAAIFAGIWVLHFFVVTAEGGRFGTVGLVAASTMMLHANHLMFVATFAALLVAQVVVSFDRAAIRRVLVAGVATVAINAPWIAIYFTAPWLAVFAAGPALVGGSPLAGAPPPLPMTAWSKLGDLAFAFSVQVRRLDFVAFPVLVLLLFVVWILVEGREKVWRAPTFRRSAFLFVFVLADLAVVSTWEAMYLRYVINLLPALALLQAAMLSTVGRRRPVLAAAIALVMLTSDAAHGWTSGLAHRLAPYAPVRSALLGYMDEVTEDFDGPIESIVRHLEKEGRAGDRVYITYGDLPLRFYTDFTIRGGQGCQSPVVMPPPEWVIVRYFFRTWNTAPGTPADIRRHMQYVEREVPWPLYQRIELRQVDTIWENVAEPQWHHFKTPQEGPRVVLWKRVRNF